MILELNYMIEPNILDLLIIERSKLNNFINMGYLKLRDKFGIKGYFNINYIEFTG